MMAVGVIWLGILGFQSTVSGERLWIIGGNAHLGVRSNNQAIRYRFWLFNPSLRSVSVKVLPSCGCAVAQLPYDTLTPLNGFPVEVEIDPFGLPAGIEHEKAFLIECRAGEEHWGEKVVVRFRLEHVPKR